MAKKVKKWEQKAVEHPGRAHRIMKKYYPKDGINKDGTINMQRLNQLINDFEEDREERGKWPGGKRGLSEYRALILARTFKNQAKRHKRKKSRNR